MRRVNESGGPNGAPVGPEPIPDSGLVQRARDGDRAAFAAIVSAHQAHAVRLATVICGDSTEAYDIVQESFVKAWQGLDGIRADESLRPWLMRIVANQAKNSRRSLGRRKARAERHVRLRVVDAPTTDDAALTAIAAARLAATVGRLPARDRSVIACRYFAGLSEAETALALGIAAGTVKSRTARALARLRSELGPEQGVAP